MNEQARHEFFDSGLRHVDHVMEVIHRQINESFVPNRVLDFGCGVGRTLIPFASIASEVLGLDASVPMLEEAKRNCDERKLTNVSFLASDDSLSSLVGVFELIHSYIVFQHISSERGRILFENLLAHLAPEGIGALHFLYSKERYLSTYGIPPSRVSSIRPFESTPSAGPRSMCAGSVGSAHTART